MLAFSDFDRIMDEMSERDFSNRTDFGPYIHTDRKTGEVFESPFPAAVLGIRNELLGAGKVIGSIDYDEFGGMPVIAIEDAGSPTGVVEILGVECWWSAGVDDEMAEVLAGEKAGQTIVSASVYVQTLEAENN